MLNLNKWIVPARTFVIILRFAGSSASNGVSVPSTVCPKETEFFKKHASTWWDPNAIIQVLYKMTPVRVELLCKSLTDAGLVEADSANQGKPLNNIKLLEVGCGGGYMCEAIAKLGAQVTGIDANETLIHVAQEHMKQDAYLQDKVEYKTITVEEFAQKNQEKFDVVVASEVIEHVLNKEIFASHALKCLRPGGSAFFTTMNRTPISGLYYIYICEDIIKVLPKDAHEYYKFMRPNEMKDMFRRNKCTTVSTEGFTLNPVSSYWFRIGNSKLSYAMHAIKQA